MSTHIHLPGALDDLRILDLARPVGWYAGRLLADLGADVVRIEPPGGDRARAKPPCLGDQSMAYWWFNANKRSVVVDLESAEGRARYRALASEADLIIESFEPGYLDNRGIGYDALRELNPRLVQASVTEWGATGLNANRRGTDLTAMASGGLAHLGGMPYRAPTYLGNEQAYWQAGSVTAEAALIALRARDITGHGRFIDVSAQDTLIFANENAVGIFDLMGTTRERMGARSFGGTTMYFKTPTSWLSTWQGKRWDAVIGFVRDLEGDVEPLLAPEWQDLTYRDQHQGELVDIIREIATRFTKERMYEVSQHHRTPAAPVATIADLMDDPQLIARTFWVDVEHELPNGETALVRYPGAPFKVDKTPWRIEHTVAEPGAHQAAPWSRPRAKALPVSAAAGPQQLPLAGIRVVDLTWVIAGPGATQALADHGAEVLKIESTVHPDGLRAMAIPRPPWNGSHNVSGIFSLVNTSKKSVSINMNAPGGRNMLCRLIKLADVLVDNYGVDPLPKWGLSPAELWKINPDLIIARSSVMGRSGPRSHFVGLGYTIGPAAGLYAFSGFPGDPPVGSCTAHPDYSSNPHHLLVAILAALRHRARTGEGQLIDLSQHESTVVFNGPLVLDYSLTGRLAEPNANRHPEMAPHGIYPCHGEDRWVAICCETGDDWRCLAALIGRADLAADPGLCSLAGRKAREDELDAALADWTRQWTPAEVEATLKAANLPVAVVQDARGMRRDPHLAARHKFVRLAHSEMGIATLNGPNFRLSDLPPDAQKTVPLLGEHTEDVTRELLGLDEEEIVNAYLDEVLQ